MACQSPGMTEAFPNSGEAIAFAVEDLGRLLRRRIDNALSNEALTRPQWRLMAYVLREPGLGQTSLAERLELARAATGATVDQLERIGLIERRPDVDDRRIWRIYPTPQAMSLLARLRGLSHNVLGDVLHGFEPGEIALLAQQFRRLIRNMQETDR